MPSGHQQAVQEQFTRTAAVFSRHAPRDTPAVLSERVEFAELVPGEKILDVACGPGAFVLTAATRAGFARGIDLTAEMLGQARSFQRERGVTNACFDHGEAEHLPYAAAAFDLASCQFAFHHMASPAAVLSEMVRVVRAGGRLMIVDSIGPEDRATARLHNHIERLRDPSHTLTLSLSEMLALFATQGLQVLKQDVRDRSRSFNQWMLRAGAKHPDARYETARGALEASIAGDTAGFSVRVSGDDLTIVHQEAMFLLKKDAS